MVTAQKTSVEVLRRELHLRFQDELQNAVQGPSDILTELVVDPVEMSKFPLFFQEILNRDKQEEIRAGRRVPLRSEGAALPCILPFPVSSIGCPSPPHTNRGVTKRIESETKNITICPVQQAVTARRPILGGYDGGFEAGFNGDWSPLKFKTLLQTLEVAKLAAENGEMDEKYVTLGHRTFAVMPHGVRLGASYKYVLEGEGMKIYLHSNPKGSIQGIRIRYGTEALAGRDAFAVHVNTLEWLKEIGFTVTKECLSRADLQTLSFRPIEDFTMPIFANRSVKKASQYHFYGKGNKPVTSFTLGAKIQLCIYDKRQELIDTCDEVKMSMIVNDCLCGEFPDHLTRIEFRLRRDALKYFGINTVQDLLEKEHALVDFLTFDWFRLIAGEKSKGNETRQELDPVWQEVRDLFFEYFPGPVENRKPIDRNTPGRREIKCTGNSLIKQAVGCLATAAALAKGVFETECQALAFVADVVGEKVKTLCNRVRERVIELGIVRGVEPPDAIDWHLDPRYASDSAEAVIYEFRAVFDEDVQYDRVRNFAVAGCPF